MEKANENVGSEMLPYKVVDCTRERRFGIVASSLQDFINRGKIFCLLEVVYIKRIY